MGRLFVTDEDNGTEGVGTLISDETDALCSEYTDPERVLCGVDHNYQGIIDNIDIKIERENYRLDQERDRLSEKFSNLETPCRNLPNRYGCFLILSVR